MKLRALAFLALACAAPAFADYTAVVDPAVRYQTWEGWGTSLAWWANVVGGYPEPIRTSIVDQAIGKLKLNVMRYNIGGGENPSMSTMEVRARVPGFLKADGTYDWTADANQRWVLRRAIQLGANKFEAFSNSPPYFMTVSGSVTGATDGGNNLLPEKATPFANYLATVVKHFSDFWGVKFETLEPMNEPVANWWVYGGRQEGCHIDAGQRQSDLVVACGNALKSLRSPTTVSASDESYNDWAVSSWDAMSSDAKAFVSRLNTHCYGGSSQHWVNHRATHDGKRLWMSEYGDGDASGMTMAWEIVRDLRVMMPTAWVYWQVAEPGSGGGWGCIQFVDDGNGKLSYYLNKKYYALAQFSRYIRPGARLIGIGDANSICALDGNQLVIVTVNGDTAQNATFDLSRFSRVGSRVSAYRTSPSENLLSVGASLKSKKLSASLPANSITTFVIDGCGYDGRTFGGFQTLTSLRSNQLLTVPGTSWSDGTLLTTAAARGALNQQWRVESAADGWYHLCNRESGRYAALWDSSANNYPVLQWSDNGDTTLNWGLAPLSDGSFRLASYRYSGKCMVENPTRGNGWPDVGIYDWYNGQEQHWKLSYAAPFYPEVSGDRQRSTP